LGGGGNVNADGSINTGGGGGAITGSNVRVSAGGSGVVIVQYPATYNPATVTGSPTYNVIGANRVYTFTGSGTITIPA
jgi:hypothetical protein